MRHPEEIAVWPHETKSERRFRSLGLHQSAAINNHPDCSGTLHRNLNGSVPDPTFPAPTQKKSSSLAMEG